MALRKFPECVWTQAQTPVASASLLDAVQIAAGRVNLSGQGAEGAGGPVAKLEVADPAVCRRPENRLGLSPVSLRCRS